MFEQIIRNFDDVEKLTGKKITLGGSRHLILKLQAQNLSADYARLYKESNRIKEESLSLEKMKEKEAKEKEIRNIIEKE